ncbi:phospholipase D-like domain-containing protein [Streptomyces sp. NPDC056452]|uniref:phospholipase D-like domain-containing protein n=1 Tax=Streptomyces sp. NPDC056452 TaxID=3345821 RepID=UPI003683A91D
MSYAFRLGPRTTVLAAALLAASSIQGVSVAQSADIAKAPLDVEVSGPVFNNPLGSQADQEAIREKILGFIRTSPQGSSIKVALYHFWDQEVAQALADAHSERGVSVQLMLDESTVSSRPTDASYETLRASLGTDLTGGSFVGLCPAGKSCLGRPEFGQSINHNKFWLFSQVDGAADVVVQTSSNLSPSSYSMFWNDAFVATYNTGLYQSYSSYFGKLTGRDWATWKYTSASWSPYKAYFFPYYPGTGNSTDTIWNTLDNVACAYTASDGSTKATKVRVGMFKFTRQGVADKLVELKKAGCSVELVYTETDSADSSGTAGTWEKLHSVSGLNPVCYFEDTDQKPSTAQRIIHSKYLLIDGKYDGAVNKVVWTGSHNYSGPALRENDEALLKIDDSAVHDAYLANFTSIKSHAVPGTSDNVPACKGVTSQPEQ